MKWSSLFIIPVKESDNFAIDWLTLLSRNFSMYLFSLYYISKDNYSKYYPNQIRIRAMVSLYLM